MPTFYESEPIEKITITLNSSDYQNAYLFAEQNISPMHRRSVKTVLCINIAILIASFIPFYANHYSSYWIPICAVFLMLVAAGFFFLEQPRIIKKWAAQIFESNQFLRLSNQMILYRDCIVIENEYEKISEYWTDFDKCLENSGYFVLTGGINRYMLVIKKQDMSKEQICTVSTHMENTFARHYYKFKH